jgi:hypothetical protein
MNDEQRHEIARRVKGMDARVDGLKNALAGLLHVADSHPVEDALAAIKVALMILTTYPEDAPTSAAVIITRLDAVEAELRGLMVRGITDHVEREE